MITVSYDSYGVPTILKKRVRAILGHSQKPSPDLDAVIQELGPHGVAHFMTTTRDAEAADELTVYLNTHWPAYGELIERMVFAARREVNEHLMSDFGQS